uniref:Kinetochore protein NDC80 n=1 Tax=Lepisosteus oculatus TaxID=7918 RepID=W5MII4_LEPOC
MSRASSSRQSLLPLRVADNARMSLATPQPKERPGLGKLSIAKPQSGTSERRTSFFGKRTSGAGMFRNSAFGTFGGTEKMKDPRPLHDKAYVQQCIKQLSEFLSDNGFPNTVTMKSLQSPSTKEFLRIFSFICSFLDPTFDVPTSKIEEEIPKILRELGYPFAISKSSMYSVGAPHTWPQILGALMWLIDVVKLSNNMKSHNLLFSGFPECGTEIEDGAEFTKIFVEYVSKAYNRFMQGADTFEEEDKEYLCKLKKLYNFDEAHMETLSFKHKVLTEEVERLEKETHQDRIMAKQAEKIKAQTDLQKIQNYLSNLETFKTNLEQSISALSNEIEGEELQVGTLKKEQSRLQHKLENQKFSQADIERINLERNELQQTIATLTKSLEEAEHHMWNEEIALAKAKESLDTELAEYHRLARKLQLIPSSAENACGRDFEIRISPDAGPSNIAQYKAQIHIPLMNLISETEEENRTLSNQKLSLQETLEQVNSNIADKMNDTKLLKEQIRKLEGEMEQELQEMEREEQKWASELESMESNKKLLEKRVTEGYDEAVEQLKAAQQQYHLVLQETKEQSRTVARNLSDVFDTATNHLSILEKAIQEHHKRIDQDYRATLQDDELKDIREMIEKVRAKL